MNTSYNSNRIKKASTGILILLHYIFVGLDLKQYVTARMGVESFRSHLSVWVTSAKKESVFDHDSV